jgi:hypothetical protein
VKPFHGDAPLFFYVGGMKWGWIVLLVYQKWRELSMGWEGEGRIVGKKSKKGACRRGCIAK